MDDNIRVSEFNELQFKMIRIHKLQDQINILWVNPTMMNFGFGTYNYESIYANLQMLYGEVYAKCTPDEIESYENIKNRIDELIENNPPYEIKNHPTGKKPNFNKDNWKEINNELHKLYLLIRKLLDAHGYSPDKNVLRGL